MRKLLSYLICNLLVYQLVQAQYSTTLFGSAVSLSIQLINSNQQIQFNVTLPKGSYLGIVYSGTMKGSDAVAFKASSTSPAVEDMYASGHYRPSTDAQNDYTTTYTSNSSYVSFVSSRKLNTGDSNDYIVTLVTI